MKAALAACLVAAPASAMLLPPSSDQALPHGFVVIDDRNERQDLGALAAGMPRVVVPVFTRCAGTCPLTSVLLKDALARASVPFRVVVLSFDSGDTASDLREFRARFTLPAEWILVRSADPTATRDFLGRLGFRFRKASSGGFDHPNQAFVFSPDGAWSGTFAGPGFPGDDLDTAWRRATARSHPTAMGRLRAWLVRPEAWIALACMGLGMATIAIVFAVRRPAHQPR